MNVQDDNEEKKVEKTEDTCSQKKPMVKQFFLLWIIFASIFILSIDESIFSVSTIFKAIIGGFFCSVVNSILNANFKFGKK